MKAGCWSALNVPQCSCSALFPLIQCRFCFTSLQKTYKKLHYTSMIPRGSKLISHIATRLNGTILLWAVPDWVELQGRWWGIVKLPKHNRFPLLLPEQRRQWCFFKQPLWWYAVNILLQLQQSPYQHAELNRASVWRVEATVSVLGYEDAVQAGKSCDNNHSVCYTS